MLDPDDILQFWFGDASENPAQADSRLSLWFEASPEVDDRIRERFGPAVEAAARGEHDAWGRAPRPEIAGTAPPEWRAMLETFPHYAERHLELIARFGRFPHRNAVLGRASTPEEKAYLDGGGETFGQR